MLKDFIKYLDWDEKRVQLETEKMNLLLADATTYYSEEFK